MSSKRKATYEDILALPPDVVGQLLDGELIVMPRPAMGHARVSTMLGMDLGSPFQRGRGGPGGWMFLFEPELHFGDDVVVPDLAAWRIERMPGLPTAAQPFLTVAPDWVCEVLSPSTAGVDRVTKKAIYARERVAHYWLVDPLARTLEAFQLENGRWLDIGTHLGDERVRVAPFEAVELELAALWSPTE